MRIVGQSWGKAITAELVTEAVQTSHNESPPAVPGLTVRIRASALALVLGCWPATPTARRRLP